MAIDHMIDYDCVPRQALGTAGILERLKGRERAEAIIALFRKNGDPRPPTEMGFEFTRRTPEGDEEHRIVVVQDLLDEAAELDPLAGHCAGCPANRIGAPYGCMGYIGYPVSAKAEGWLLDRLPVPDEPLIWLLLKQVVQEFRYTGATVAGWRGEDSSFFEAASAPRRRLGEIQMDGDMVFEMLFTRRAHILPRQGALLLMFFGAIERDLEADAIRALDPAPPDAPTRYPFLLTPEEADDESITALKGFLHAVYLAWILNVNLLLDV